MPGPSDPEPPQGSHPLGRRRAPTITIDTTAVNTHHDADMSPEPHPHPNSSLSPQEDITTPSTIVDPPAGLSPGALYPDMSLDNKDGSRPTSPHNISNPLLPRASDSGAAYLSVPSNHSRPRQNSTDSQEVSALSISSQGETTMVASSHTQANKFKVSGNDKIMKDQNALSPDTGTEADFDFPDNPFAFSPGQLNKMFNPKSLAAFYKLGGLSGLEKGLRTDRKTGLSPDEAQLGGHVTFEEATTKGHDESMMPSKEEIRVETIAHASTTRSRPSDQKPFSDRRRVFRDNNIPPRKGKTFLQLVVATYNDKMLILLSIAAVISLAIGLYQTFDTQHKDGEPKIDWVEGVAIVVAISIVVAVASLTDWSRERRFSKLNKKKQDRDVRVVRCGKTTEIFVGDIMVGDVVHLEPGDVVPADGVLIAGFNLKCDESQTTGESDIIRKRPADEVYAAIRDHESLKKMDPFIQSGARIMEGVGTFLVTSTGTYSTHGRTLMALNEDPEVTPLQVKLNLVATWIAKMGCAVGLLLFIVLFIQFLVRLPRLTDSTPAEKGRMFLDIFIMVVTIIVVAVPEGLPLAVTLALSFATSRMLKNGNLVRYLKACEVMGNATTICSDKTGTLTQNKMQIVAATVGTSLRFGGTRPVSRDEDATTPIDTGADITAVEFASMLSASVKELLVKSIALNSTAFEGQVDGEKTFIGSKTETALLLFAREYLGMGSVSEERDGATTLQMIPFDSSRKCMGIVVSLPGGRARLYVKGASEIVLGRCTQILRDAAVDDSVTALSPSNSETVTHMIESYAMRSLRTIGICHRDFDAWPPKEARIGDGGKEDIEFADMFRNMCFIGMVGIQDPLREGVYESVKVCQQAGVVVRMVTGDNKLTAQAIAKECGILQPNSIVMEGPDFRNLSKLQQEEIIPRLHVLARSSPEDKRILVKRLKDKNETVAVTGDGTNDAPALKMADVGFSMGIAGTEVAKEASDIILMDDNFSSIVRALKWGRAVNDGVKRFLQFQLTVNITAVVLTFVTAVSSQQEKAVLTAVQLLWVNLIMDTLAALALATDPPQDSVVKRLPEPKGAPLVSITMWKMILGQTAYQLVITFILYYGIPQHWFDPFTIRDELLPEEVNTMVFNTFVWMQIFNQWNNRRLDNRFNIFEGLSKNWIFVVISILMCGGQVLIIFIGGAAFQIAKQGQDGSQWLMAVVLGLLSIPMGVVLRLIPDEAIAALIPGFLKNRARRVPGLTVSDEEMGQYPEPLADLRDQLKFMRRMKGGRLNNLKFKIQQRTETVLRQRSRSPSHSRSDSTKAPRTPTREDSTGDVRASTPESRHRAWSTRSRSNSALGAPTVMAGIVAAGVAAGWSPTGRVNAEENTTDEKGSGSR
ncbi:hypothetical protein CDD80_2719 [Ophiocordyceps camponoti-rufipedis]|uniref:Calcium-transporting ATPase n=1 Tax=Ophiocordyceps camponoti-rufipedis TaxID=2004952 RepID=A0A2C5Z4S3_9HYPO|nr:hypothetical protein CDD80_2719 [Ophiocordyceps camponoti-rufipedis]